MMEGVVNILKPPGMTSSDVVVDLRHIFGTKRVGHTGTLDPGAAGVLPVCIGRATRLFDHLVEKEKTYIAEICFGVQTDTQDSYGNCIAVSDADVSQEMLEAVLPEFLGEIKQIAPMYSAVKFQGKKLCDIARHGGEVERKIRSAKIHTLKVLDQLQPNRYLLKICCSRGTYIRTLCEDIGAALGVPAHMSFLLREASGAFTLEHAYSIAELRCMKEEGCLQDALISIEEALFHYPALHLPETGDAHKRLLNGCRIPLEELEGIAASEGFCRVYCGSFLGIGQMTENELRLTLMLTEVPDGN